MNSCSRSDDVLRYLMEELDAAETEAFERHLDSCPSCRAEVRLERALQKGLAVCSLPDAAPAGLRPGVLTGILTVKHPRFPWWQITATVAAGAAAFAALLRVFEGSGLAVRAGAFLSGAAGAVSSLFSGVGSLPLILGTGILMVGIASIIASLVPED
jgi:anti-sigma factor RsiW